MALEGDNDVMSALLRCINFAAIKHSDGRRKNKAQTPYINHPIANSQLMTILYLYKIYMDLITYHKKGVAYILTEEANVTDRSVIEAAILHDTVEDTDTTFEELRQYFGQKVTEIVTEVTDDKNLPKMERKALQIQNAQKLSFQAKLIRLADKLYNLRDLSRELPVGWSESRKTEYFNWAKKVVDPMRGTNAVMEKQLDQLFSLYCS